MVGCAARVAWRVAREGACGAHRAHLDFLLGEVGAVLTANLDGLAEEALRQREVAHRDRRARVVVEELKLRALAARAAFGIAAGRLLRVAERLLALAGGDERGEDVGRELIRRAVRLLRLLEELRRARRLALTVHDLPGELERARLGGRLAVGHE